MPKYNIISLLNDSGAQALAEKKYTDEIIALNEKTSDYGLVLSEEQAKELTQTRTKALRDNGRIEVGLGAVKPIIEEFATCSCINPNEYSTVLNELTEIFYYIKSESDDQISDNRLIAFMREYFEKICGGSADLLASRDLEMLLRYINSGKLKDNRRAKKKRDDFQNMHYEDYDSAELDGEDDYSNMDADGEAFSDTDTSDNDYSSTDANEKDDL